MQNRRVQITRPVARRVENQYYGPLYGRYPNGYPLNSLYNPYNPNILYPLCRPAFTFIDGIGNPYTLCWANGWYDLQ
jgi:hypothetical protein